MSLTLCLLLGLTAMMAHAHPEGGFGGDYIPAFIPSPYANDKLTEVDKLFSRLSDFNSYLQIVSEAFSSISEMYPPLKKRVNDMIHKRDRLEAVTAERASKLTIIQDLVDELTELVEANVNMTDRLSATQEDILNDLTPYTPELTDLMTHISDNEGVVKGLEEKLVIAQHRLEDYTETSYGKVKRLIAELQHSQENLKTEVDRQKCETGSVHIHRDDHHSTVFFKTDFGTESPRVLYGIAGYTFNLKSRSKPYRYHPSNYHDYGYYGGVYGGHNPDVHGGFLEPNALGVFVQATPSSDGIVFQIINMAFGDSDLVSVKVNYQACNVGSSHEDFILPLRK